jgi:hypothetical protein
MAKNQINRIFSRSKYNSKVSNYNGRNYDSALECSYAQQLDWLIKAKEVKSWEPQHKIEIYVNGIHICNYFIDFKVIFEDGHEEYHEVKGFETDVWKMKWKLSKAVYPDYTFVLIK